MATEAQLAEKLRRENERGPVHRETTRKTPPPVPPRWNSAPAPPSDADEDARRSRLISQQWRSADPRSSSTHSLLPSEAGRENNDGRRTLLLIYIHGFMGNETSFQSFPAHVHNLLTISLAETHVVHTKIYPRYKSRKAMDFARDDLGTWLEPYETHYADIVLLGHSMGGILSAEVALQPSPAPATGKPLAHHILGTISFDTPFLGMHPGVIVSGLGSLFRPAPEPPGQQKGGACGIYTPSVDSQSVSTPSTAPSIIDSDLSSQLSPTQSTSSPLATRDSKDPFYDAPFPNDVRLPERKGWTSILHFINKHSDGLTSATQQFFMSHIEFGSCLADYPGLKNRYERIRALEDVNEDGWRDGPGFSAPTRRIRFANYYTASTGRPKVPKSPKISEGHMVDKDGNIKAIEVEMQDVSLETTAGSLMATPRISIERTDDNHITPKPLHEGPGASAVEAQMKDLGGSSGVHDEVQEEPPMEMRHIDSIPVDVDEEELIPTENLASASDRPSAELQSSASEPPLPPIPPMPTEPEEIDLSVYTDKDSHKIAEKEQKRVMKVYQQAMKDRESAIRDRQKLKEKRGKQAKQDREKQRKAEEKERQKEEKEAERQRVKEEKEEEKRKATINPEARERQGSVASSANDRAKRDKKFCMLPPEYGGKRDKCWIRVYMEGVDEVGAHCGLFFAGPQYESLVGDVGARIEKWVQEDAGTRAALAAEV